MGAVVGGQMESAISDRAYFGSKYLQLYKSEFLSRCICEKSGVIYVKLVN